MHLLEHKALASRMLITSLWNEVHVTLDVASCFVVLAVSNLKAKVWRQEDGMANPAYRVVQDPTGGDVLVSTLVCQNPKAGSEKALNDSVDRPEYYTSQIRRDELRRAKPLKHDESGTKTFDVSGNIAKAPN